MHRFSPATLSLALALAVNACSKDEQSTPAPAGDPTQTPTASAVADTVGHAPATSIDPCTFLTKEDLESALGRVFAAGKATRGEPSCTFESTMGNRVMIAVPTASVSKAEFDSWKQMAGSQAEAVSGVGDAAYFWGSRFYVHAGTRTFTISVPDEELTAQTRAALTKLGQAGAAKLM